MVRGYCGGLKPAMGVGVGIFERLRHRELEGASIPVAVVGMGFVGRGLALQLDLTPGMRPALLVNRTLERAMEAWGALGHAGPEVVVSDDPDVLAAAVADGRPAATSEADLAAEVAGIEVVVEVTGAVEHGAGVAELALKAGKHLVSLNYECDATVGHLLKKTADDNGVVYTGSDGDQPGVMARLVEYVRGIGFEVVAAVNCKGFMDIRATPESIREWAERQRTSLRMTTAFTDGTKMNVENACVANATGLRPERRGMHGVETNLASALEDFRRVLAGTGVVDYTLGGDFGGGVFVIGSADQPDPVAHYMRYLKMGDGPWYLFYRPWHLVHFETPISIAEAVLDHQATVAPRAPVAEVVALAKRDLRAGERLDGIGGYTCYGEIEAFSDATGLLPVGLADHARLIRDVPRDDPIPLDAVELDEGSPLVEMRRRQDGLLGGAPERALTSPSA